MKRFAPSAMALLLLGLVIANAEDRPRITGVAMNDTRQLVIQAEVPAGYRHATLQANGAPVDQFWETMVAGPMTGDEAAMLTFTLPDPSRFALVRVTLGESTTIPTAKHNDERWLQVEYVSDRGSGSGGTGSGGNGGSGGGNPTQDPDANPAPTSKTEKIGHLLNRIAYGPSKASFEKVEELGIEGYIEDQLNTRPMDTLESVQSIKADDYFQTFVPGEETYFIQEGATWTFFKGRSEPPSNWKDVDFIPTFWEKGPAGIGYGDGDDETVLDDMRGSDGYLSLYTRHTFDVEDPANLENVRLRISYDDGFVAYLNGQEFARANVAGNPPAFDDSAQGAAGNVDNSNPNEFNVDDFRSLMREGKNVLAVQVHNQSRTSSDLSFSPAFYHAPSPGFQTIRGLDELQELVHAQGVYSDRQLQVVLTDFWENHFTTDVNKLEDHLEEREAYERLMTSDADNRRLYAQIAREAAQMEFQEYTFFHDHALGYFGDLLLYSATSPAMLIYLDNVGNLKESPNENYAREILELYAFGVDNRYTQRDIEQLAKCFTGWTVRKVRPDALKFFPDIARAPYTTPSLAIERETPIVDLGAGWRFIKGTQEPSANASGEPTTAWTEPGFDTSGWTEGASGIGYGDGDDATILDDMRGNYLTAYARREFVLEAGLDYDELVLDMAYDDGYVAYLNGVEIGRSYTMRNYGSPPAFDRSSRNHGNETAHDTVFLANHLDLLKPAPEINVLAVQVHNTSLNSSDLTLGPRIVSRTYTDDSIDETSSGGLWSFRFQPEQHNTEEKILFEGTPHQLRIPAERTGAAGVNDAIEVIDAMINHPSTREFIVIKLVNKLVSDEISLASYHDATAPPELIALVDQGIAAWTSTARPGHMGTIVRTLLDPTDQKSAFWSGIAYRSKVKSAVEYVNSTMRALDVPQLNDRVSEVNEDLGMTIFEREEPDGFPEEALGWMDTQGLLERIKFGQALTQGLTSSGTSWDPASFLQKHALTTPQDVINHFNQLYFQSHLTEENQAILLDYVDTDAACLPSLWSNQSNAIKRNRLRDLVGLILASPDFQFQ
ncbi:DUF1800 domain-containing protein [Verrucomicrobiales bacterium]|nr:DUF1800 domain-containing protein [Verrucomicrobiales bacterium]